MVFLNANECGCVHVSFHDDFGFFDQAHLINDFKGFAGETPASYVRRKPVVEKFFMDLKIQ